jgi:hypothetical protein
VKTSIDTIFVVLNENKEYIFFVYMSAGEKLIFYFAQFFKIMIQLIICI